MYFSGQFFETYSKKKCKSSTNSAQDQMKEFFLILVNLSLRSEYAWLTKQNIYKLYIWMTILYEHFRFY